MVGPSNMAAIGFTYAQQMLYPVLFQISGLKFVKRFWVRPKRFWDIFNEFQWLLVFSVPAIRKYCSNYLTTPASVRKLAASCFCDEWKRAFTVWLFLYLKNITMRLRQFSIAVALPARALLRPIQTGRDFATRIFSFQ